MVGATLCRCIVCCLVLLKVILINDISNFEHAKLKVYNWICYQATTGSLNSSWLAMQVPNNLKRCWQKCTLAEVYRWHLSRELWVNFRGGVWIKDLSGWGKHSQDNDMGYGRTGELQVHYPLILQKVPYQRLSSIVAVLVFDLTNPHSFDNITHWLGEIK